MHCNSYGASLGIQKTPDAAYALSLGARLQQDYTSLPSVATPLYTGLIPNMSKKEVKYGLRELPNREIKYGMSQQPTLPRKVKDPLQEIVSRLLNQ
ncbi:hypothetical protein CL620_05950 [archaeon]|nr:hypothetical protein [archaeon]|tara:strand:+ start:181 stop:468 length:288 start_codon:yes stop_codon:yes gene_type:complete